MENLDQMFANFFATIQQSNSVSATQRTERSRPKGYLNEFRVEAFAHVSSSVEQLLGSFWTELAGRVYRLRQYWLLVVIGYYEDGTMLWLDNHLDDADFAEFVRREGLAQWLPERQSEVVSLLLETKFFYLGLPQLIRDTSDISVVPESLIRSLTDSTDNRWTTAAGRQKALESLRERDRRLASVADQIRPPECVRLENGDTRLSFCIWAKILGNVVKIDTLFNVKGSFTCESTLLAEQVGYFTVPR